MKTYQILLTETPDGRYQWNVLELVRRADVEQTNIVADGIDPTFAMAMSAATVATLEFRHMVRSL